MDRSVDDAERVAQLEALERLKAAAAAAQAVVTADFVASQRAAQRSAGGKADKVGQGDRRRRSGWPGGTRRIAGPGTWGWRTR